MFQLPGDAPESALSGLREQRLTGETTRKQAAAGLLIIGLQQRLSLRSKHSPKRRVSLAAQFCGNDKLLRRKRRRTFGEKAPRKGLEPNTEWTMEQKTHRGRGKHSRQP